MGELHVEALLKSPNNSEYIKQLLIDIEALDYMLKNDMFEKNVVRIGAEQEFCLVDEDWQPSNKAMEILEEINDSHFTTEIALYNLEINLDPLPLKGTCFSEMHKQLNDLLKKAEQVALKHRNKIILTGVLPTITQQHLELPYMTPIKRYKILNEAIKEIRKHDFELHIKGVDELNVHHDSVLYEGCNTSYQAHLQIDPVDFRDTYNWSQAIAGPLLSICTNSPILMGRELWQETRIALFTQSVDTRASTFLLNEREARVNFGNDWVRGHIVDFYRESIVGFRSMLTTNFNTDSLTEIKSGTIPKLRALNLHNGTVYKWNRLCYGTSDGKPHVRIENRYLPAGPTTADEIANMMFWVGIMKGRPKKYDDLHTKMDFKDVKTNFYNAARYGMATQFYWDGALVSSRELILNKLLPMAFRGLYAMGVAPVDAEHYLSIIEKRIASHNGARWTVKAYRAMRKEHKPFDALAVLTASMYQQEKKGYAIDAWELPRGDEHPIKKEFYKVKQVMNTRTITAQENDSAELVLKMMQWKNIHHVPILDHDLNVVGLLTWTDVERYLGETGALEQSIRDIMKTKLVTITEEELLATAKDKMQSNAINCLPVVNGKKLVGIITSNDL